MFFDSSRATNMTHNLCFWLLNKQSYFDRFLFCLQLNFILNKKIDSKWEENPRCKSSNTTSHANNSKKRRSTWVSNMTNRCPRLKRGFLLSRLHQNHIRGLNHQEDKREVRESGSGKVLHRSKSLPWREGARNSTSKTTKPRSSTDPSSSMTNPKEALIRCGSLWARILAPTSSRSKGRSWTMSSIHSPGRGLTSITWALTRPVHLRFVTGSLSLGMTPTNTTQQTIAKRSSTFP